jgi:hypothetical protein
MDMDFIPGNQLLLFIVAVLPSFAQNVLDERIPPHFPGTSECVLLLFVAIFGLPIHCSALLPLQGMFKTKACSAACEPPTHTPGCEPPTHAPACPTPLHAHGHPSIEVPVSPNYCHALLT